ncbi:hypothetical protein GCM10007907_04410 [Chitinimonas prasina]|uniref:Peptidyl-prolyl cis-trans isomerase n=1 Tax=Chitinimonas prasina TaxID=1434937 RepID=A0ABQ5YAR2_9NEIS|nr:peptidylprolyl isomerase [Chitinimonas prasina]GLR11651.1 hypothetical protein GCM10007907_04410 [Chitinimonas prasina]
MFLSRFQSLYAVTLALLLATPLASQATTVRLETSLGPVDIELYDAEAPKTVTNFLGYVKRGDYNSSFMHRSVPGFVVQGGGFAWRNASNSVDAIPTQPAVDNEFSTARLNKRGTVAMAKLDGQANSATSQWFVNLADNPSLDSQNGGFTVFGKVKDSSMAVIDAMAKLQRVNAGSPFNELPITSMPSGYLGRSNLVMVNRAAVYDANYDADRVFDYLEATYPQYLGTVKSTSASAAGYYLRYYPGKEAYIGTANGTLYYLVPSISPNVESLGPMADWIKAVAAAGY